MQKCVNIEIDNKFSVTKTEFLILALCLSEVEENFSARFCVRETQDIGRVVFVAISAVEFTREGRTTENKREFVGFSQD